MPSTTNAGASFTVTDEVETEVCDWCGAEVERSTMHTAGNVGRQEICESCYNDSFECDACGDRHPQSEHYTMNNGDWVCEHCVEDTLTCDHCGERFYQDSEYIQYYDSVEQYRCSDCAPDETEEVENSVAINTDRYPAQNGEILKSKRFFGIELEASGYYDGVDMVQGWGSTYDGSLDEGREFVSPPMRGFKAEEEIKEMCDNISNENMHATAQCGYHIHIDVPDLSDAEFRRLFYGYIAFDSLFLEMLPPSRRNSRWAKPMTSLIGSYVDADMAGDADAEDILRATDGRTLTADELEKLSKPTEELDDNTKAAMNWNSLYRLVHHIYKQHNKIEKVNASAVDLVNNSKAMTLDVSKLEKWWYSQFRNGGYYYAIHNKNSVERRKYGGKYDNTRYAGVNWHIYFSSGNHFEVRYHSGTLNPRKIMMWAEIHTRFTDALISKRNLSQPYLKKVLNLSVPKKLKAFQHLTGVDDQVIGYMKERMALFANNK